MSKITLSLICLVAGLIVLSGCNGGSWYQQETLLDKNWGRSHGLQKYSQIIDHDADTSDPVDGMAGEPASNSVEKYNKSFKDTKKQETVNILKLQ